MVTRAFPPSTPRETIVLLVITRKTKVIVLEWVTIGLAPRAVLVTLSRLPIKLTSLIWWTRGRHPTIMPLISKWWWLLSSFSALEIRESSLLAKAITQFQKQLLKLNWGSKELIVVLRIHQIICKATRIEALSLLMVPSTRTKWIKACQVRMLSTRQVITVSMDLVEWAMSERHLMLVVTLEIWIL